MESLTSLYELTNSWERPARMRFIDNFSGTVLNSDIWDTTLSNGGTVAMSDSVDGGLILSTGTTSGTSKAQIDCNDKLQFGMTSSMVWTAIHSHSANGESYTGLTSGAGFGTGQGIWSYVNTGWKTSNFDLYTVGVSAGTWTNGTIGGLTSNHTQKLELTGSAGNSYVDGVLNCTSTTNLPSTNMQPEIGLSSSDTTNKTINVTYCEAWNT